MARANDTVAALFDEYADLLAITGGDAMKIRSYQKAARAIAGHASDVSTLDVKALRQIPSVGASIADKITEYLATGKLSVVDALRAKIPAGVRALTEVAGLGPRKAMVLYQELGVSNLDALEAAIESGQVAALRGFGARTAENLRHGIELARGGTGRFLLDTATAVAEELVAMLSAVSGCQRCTYAGSLRRQRETIGDIDILAAAEDSAPLMRALLASPLVAEVIATGDKKTSIRTIGGPQVDLRVVPRSSWGAALQYFTGSKEHNVRVRELAVRKGLKLSEYGLFRADDDTLIVSETEEEVYQHLGLAWIPPTLREDRGEVAAATEGRLPDLVTLERLRGDLHTHTNLTDGVSSLAEMVAAARARGLSYYAVTDHAKNLAMQRMTDAKMLAQREELAALAGSGSGGSGGSGSGGSGSRRGMALLHGSELNIDPDGEVDWGPEFLSGFDLCVASIHSHFTLSSQDQTHRLIRACANPYINIIGHPTTRQIGRRERIDADWDAVFAAAARTGTAMEINSYPDRLDLPEDLIARALGHGVRFAINTDSHSTMHLAHHRFGAALAQRAWLTPEHVINTWPLAKLRRFVAAKRNATSRAR